VVWDFADRRILSRSPGPLLRSRGLTRVWPTILVAVGYNVVGSSAGARF